MADIKGSFEASPTSMIRAKAGEPLKARKGSGWMVTFIRR